MRMNREAGFGLELSEKHTVEEELQTEGNRLQEKPGEGRKKAADLCKARSCSSGFTEKPTIGACGILKKEK